MTECDRRVWSAGEEQRPGNVTKEFRSAPLTHSRAPRVHSVTFALIRNFSREARKKGARMAGSCMCETRYEARYEVRYEARTQ